MSVKPLTDDHFAIDLMNHGWMEELDGRWRNIETGEVLARVLAIYRIYHQQEHFAHGGESLSPETRQKAREGKQRQVPRAPSLEELDRR